MSYVICEIKIDKEWEDPVASLLEAAGADGVSVEGAPLVSDAVNGGLAEAWDERQLSLEDRTLTVKGYFGSEGFDEREKGIRAAIAVFETLNDIRLETVFYQLMDEDWQERWKEFYKPFRVGRRLVVKPTWEPYEAAEDDIVIEVDPGLAFGTGNHPTTAGALTLLEKYMTPGAAVLDCGCGSGILSVAAALLGAERVCAVDIDHDAILATVKNIRVNNVLTKVEVFHDDATKRTFPRFAPFQTVIANIVADVILPLLPTIAPSMERGSFFIAGGIISSRRDEVLAAVSAAGFEIREILTEGDWVTLAAERI